MLHHCLSLAWLIMGLGGTYPYPINLPDGPENLARITKITKNASYLKISSRKKQFSIFSCSKYAKYFDFTLVTMLNILSKLRNSHLLIFILHGGTKRLFVNLKKST